MIFKREPVAIIATVHAILAMAIGFGLHLSAAQFALVETALIAVLALVARKTVTPNTTVDEHLDTAVRLARLTPAKPAARARQAAAKKAPG